MEKSHTIEVEPHTELTFPSGADALHERESLESFVPYVLSLWQKRAIVRRTFIISLLAGVFVAFVIPSSYDSTTRIMPPDDSSGALMAAIMGKTSSANAGAGLGALAGSLLGVKTSGALYIDLLRSRTVQGDLVQRFELQKVYRKRYQDTAIKKLDEHTTIDEDRKSGVISISVSDHDPGRAHNLANAYVDELDKLLANVSTSAARRERQFIEQRLTSVKQDMEDAERQFSEYSSKNSVLDVKEQARAMVESAAVLQGQLIAAQSELQGLEQIYTTENVRVRSAKARIAELSRQLQKVGGVGDSDSTSSADPQDPYPSIRKLPLLGVTWADLYRRTKIEETLFELLTQQYELARIEEAKEIPTIKVVDPANLPERRSFPPRVLIICLIVIFGLIGAVACVLVTETWERVPAGDPRKFIAHEIGQQLTWSWQKSNLLRRPK